MNLQFLPSNLKLLLLLKDRNTIAAQLSKTMTDNREPATTTKDDQMKFALEMFDPVYQLITLCGLGREDMKQLSSNSPNNSYSKKYRAN